MRILHIYIKFFIAFAAAILFIPFLGSVHLFDLTELSLAEPAREMIISGNYATIQVKFQPSFNNLPVFIWLQALSMHIFGINEFGARFPNAILGIITLITLFYLGRKFFNLRFGIFWTLAYAGSFLPHFYFKSGITEPWFNFFIFLSIICLVILTSLSFNFYYQRLQLSFLSGIALGLAILTNGIAAFVIVLLVICSYMLICRTWRLFSVREALLFLVSTVLIFSFWLFVIFILHDTWSIQQFLQNQIAVFTEGANNKPFFIHFIAILFGCFPASVFIFKSFRKFYSDNLLQNNFRLWMIISLGAILFLSTIIPNKLVQNSSLAYFPVSFLAAYTLDKARLRRIYFRSMIPGLILVVGGTIGILLILFPLFMKNIDYLLEYFAHAIQDDFILEALEAKVNWSGWEAIIGLLYLLVIILVFINFHKNIIAWSIALFITTIAATQASIYIYIPHFENYSQRANILFFKSHSDKNAYLETYNFKSYVHLFYGKIMPEQLPENKGENYFLGEDVDKPVYVSTKTHSRKELEEHPEFIKLDKKNGYIFYRRNIESKE